MSMIVLVGGDLPRSALDELVETLEHDKLQMIGDDYAEGISKQLLALDASTPVELQFELDSGGPVATLHLDDFCKKHGLPYRKNIPPYVGDCGENYSECVYYWVPGMEEQVIVMVDDDGEVVCGQGAVLNLFNQLWDLHQRPLSDMPLLINDEDVVTVEYAKATMAGRTFDEIFRDLLVRRIGGTIPDLPPFRIIQGR
jgi:hypothetical protein